MAKQKACKKCRFLHNEDKCPRCGTITSTDTWKGKIEIFDAEKSEIAQKLKMPNNGVYAIKGS